MANRLAHESSPYLLQHADNPVDWHPWSEEALSISRDLNRPIFLSIGYSACHWCHVMEHESFENEKIAQLLNDNFVCIKVDREERPDLDQIYMNAVMALQQGQGGWPLSVFLTPNQDVFFGGTYWPPTSRLGMPGFDHVLHGVLDAFVNRREQVDRQSREITDWLNRPELDESKIKPDRTLLFDAVATLHRNFDFENGGFGQAPKFPHTMDLSLLVRLAKTWPNDAPIDKEILIDMVRINLKKMAYGGIFDHLAGGFARYSVDEKWLVPHFEKMLYDNALLTGVYLDMYGATGDEFYAMIARKTLDYMVNYLTDDAGCFHSTEDADSEGVEGKFYVWSKDEIIGMLGDKTGTRFCELYGVTESGNFEGDNILNMAMSYGQFSELHSIDKSDLRDEMRAARKKLLQVRDQRIRPGKDDKVLVSWNGLAISSFARAAVLLGDDKYSDAATAAANFILEQMRHDSGRLFHTWRNGEAKLDGFLDDYSFLIVALLDLYNVDFDQVWIERAVALAELMIEHYSDPTGGFFFNADDHEPLISRPKSFQDSSVPSGNSMASIALLRLGRKTGNVNWVDLATKTIDGSGSVLKKSPLASGQMLIAVDLLLASSNELVVIAKDKIESAKICEAFKKARSANTCLVCQVARTESIDALTGLLEGKSLVDNQSTLYVCSGFRCSAPVVGLKNILNLLRDMA